MKIQKYKKNLSNQLYHFESSTMYCEKKDIEQTRDKVINNGKWSHIDLAQLEKIIELELLRYKLAMDQLSLDQYQKTISDEVAVSRQP